MKTDKNSQTNNAGAKSQSDSEQALTNTQPSLQQPASPKAFTRYEVNLFLPPRSFGRVYVEANSWEEAKQKAVQMDPSDVEWAVFEEKLNRRANGGLNNE